MVPSCKMTGTWSTSSVRELLVVIGSHLMHRPVNTLHMNLDIPVTAKFRVFPTVEKTVEYAKMLERAGAQILSCHGRTREQRGVNAVSRAAPWTIFCFFSDNFNAF